MDSKNDVKSRMMEYARCMKYSTRKVERMSGLSNGSLRNSAGVSACAVSAFLDANPSLSAEWLMRGSGPMVPVHEPQASSRIPGPPMPHGQPHADCAMSVISRQADIILHQQQAIESLLHQIDECKKSRAIADAGCAGAV